MDHLTSHSSQWTIQLRRCCACVEKVWVRWGCDISVSKSFLWELKDELIFMRCVCVCVVPSFVLCQVVHMHVEECKSVKSHTASPLCRLRGERRPVSPHFLSAGQSRSVGTFSRKGALASSPGVVATLCSRRTNWCTTAGPRQASHARTPLPRPQHIRAKPHNTRAKQVMVSMVIDNGSPICGS